MVHIWGRGSLIPTTPWTFLHRTFKVYLLPCSQHMRHTKYLSLRDTIKDFLLKNSVSNLLQGGVCVTWRMLFVSCGCRVFCVNVNNVKLHRLLNTTFLFTNWTLSLNKIVSRSEEKRSTFFIRNPLRLALSFLVNYKNTLSTKN